MSSPLRRHAVVVGAGIAGLATARTLSDHFEHVTVLERDELPAAAGPRRGVPQGRHAHALLSGGARAITEMFPGIMEDLVGRGAALVEFNKGHWFQAGGYRASCLIERKVISASRPFIEQVVRERVEALPNVRIEQGVAVETLLGSEGRVTGAQVFDGSISYAIEADLVVDCTGRASRGGLWMEELGFAAPRVVDVECQMRYATVILPRRPGDLGPVATHRLISSKRRRYEKLKDVPAGFLALGDSVCSFNPIYGQGMSSAVLQAVALGECLAAYGDGGELVKAFYRRAAKVIATPWQIAVGADFAYPESMGPKPVGTDLVNRYLERVLTAAQTSPEVNTAMILVQNLLASPSTLLRPSMVRTVRKANREARRRPVLEPVR